MKLMELFRPDEGDTYSITTRSGEKNPRETVQFFETENGQLYEVSFHHMHNPTVTEVIFGAVDSRAVYNTITYGRAYTSGTRQVVKIFNTIVKAVLAYDQAVGGVPVWLFTASTESKSKMYERLARRIANQTDAILHSHVDDGQTIFLVYRNTPKGKESFKQCIDYYNRDREEHEQITVPEEMA